MTAGVIVLFSMDEADQSHWVVQYIRVDGVPSATVRVRHVRVWILKLPYKPETRSSRKTLTSCQMARPVSGSKIRFRIPRRGFRPLSSLTLYNLISWVLCNCSNDQHLLLRKGRK